MTDPTRAGEAVGVRSPTADLRARSTGAAVCPTSASPGR